MNPDHKTLAVIHEATRALIDHGVEHTRESFELDRKTRSAILFEIVLLGEGAKRFSPEFRSRHPEVPWSLMAGMRDRLVHSFDTVNFDVVWEVVRVQSPEVLGAIEKFIVKERESS